MKIKISLIPTQVDFDCSFLDEDNAFQKLVRVHKKIVATARANIAELEMQDANDFESLTTLYRKIFKFLLDFAPAERGKQDRVIEREVAAALESVFPRIGLKAFVQLTKEEKNAQLMELARIVLGIRLFNRHQGRGGAGLDSIDTDCPRLSDAMSGELAQDVESLSVLCDRYQEVIVQAHLRRRREEIAGKKLASSRVDDAKRVPSDDKEEAKGSDEGVVSDWILERWSVELANRRQFLAFLKSLEDEVAASVSKVAELTDTLKEELANLAGLVGGRTSVSKEQVYPRFDSLASTWLTLWEEYHLLRARNNTYTSLKKYRNSFVPALTERIYSILGGAEAKGEETSLAASSRSARKTSASLDQDGDSKGYVDMKNAASKDRPHIDDEDGEEAAPAVEADAKDEHRSVPEAPAEAIRNGRSDLDEVAASGATLLSVHTTPDFMQLPLELQGFCPWTMVHAKGLLVPGKPALGVVRYENMYYVCEHSLAIRAFMESPEEHLNQIKERAQRNPEYIHLLRLQNYFPSASIARLIERPDFDVQVGGKAATRDASTGTPTHFVERRIDPNYHWNEWELRRRVLKVVNLKNCSTVSQQTDHSHFKRDSETQVYLPRSKGTQTRKDQGTNPATRSTYIAGLRGKIPNDAKAISQYVGADPATRKQARVVTITLDP